MKLAIIGLGYVGLPLAVAFSREFPGTVGFDINPRKVQELKSGVDRTREVDTEALRASSLFITDQVTDLAACDFFVVAVPTPIDHWNRPDLTPVIRASELLGKVLKKDDVVVFESTVYPGVTEEICGPILARVSGLQQGTDFKLGYSPERINPGDRLHTLERIVKVVSGEDAPTLDKVAAVYGTVIKAGIHRAGSIRIAEAAKVIENTQRDINIALMNELALIFDRMNIPTREVLAAAGTKWNFLPFTPGLVGGHCIGVDPYYLTTKAEELGYHPEVILAGRRINDGMGSFIAQRTIKLLVNAGISLREARIGVLGLTFKENVPDLRNSRVPDILKELSEFGIEPLIHDAMADPHEAMEEYGLVLSGLDAFQELDALILAVSHDHYLEPGIWQDLLGRVKDGGVLVDVKSCVDRQTLPKNLHYWSL